MSRQYGRKPVPAYERVLDKVVAGPGGCWLFTGEVCRGGYGRVRVGSRADGTRKRALAHRVMYEEFVGPIPDGLQIDHLCRARNCVNPEHLEAVTCRENLMRGETPVMVAHRTNTCKRGHSLADAYVQPSGGRRCRICVRERRAAR